MMDVMRITVLTSVLFMSGVSGQVLAAGDGNSTRDAFRPTGPVKINADQAEWEKGGAMVYSGDVRMESGELKLTGRKLQLQQQTDGQFEARVYGGPATLDHAGVEGGSEETRQPVSARASELIYRSSSDTVELVGDAKLTRGTDVIQGEKVRYDVARRRIQAAGKVEIVIQPPKPGTSGRAPSELPSLTPDLDPKP
tara:strand:+ start:477 stop:1064 length:588 start_codon:yes stop_codon:yes gene_type:complete